MSPTELLFFATTVWALIGAFVALIFLVIGIDRIDDDANGAYIFRPILVPGILLVWPLVLWRWLILETNRDKWPKRHMPIRNAHFVVSLLFAVAIIITMIAGFSIRQVWPTDFKPQRISSIERAAV